MEKSKRKTFSIICVVAALAISVLIITLSYVFKSKKENPSPWVLKSQDNTVVLLNDGEVVEVFGDIVLDTLPDEDIKHLESGISFLTKDEALTAVEDYDG